MAARIIAEFPAHPPPLKYEEIRARIREFIDLMELEQKKGEER